MAMLRVANCPSQELALTNAAFVSSTELTRASTSPKALTATDFTRALPFVSPLTSCACAEITGDCTAIVTSVMLRAVAAGGPAVLVPPPPLVPPAAPEAAAPEAAAPEVAAPEGEESDEADGPSIYAYGPDGKRNKKQDFELCDKMRRSIEKN